MALALSLFASARSAEAQAKGLDSVSLFLTYKFEVQNRPALRELMATAGTLQFEKWKSEGVFKDYMIFFPPYVHMLFSVDSSPLPWDMLVRLDFERYADTENWMKIERTMPGGLPAKAQTLASPQSSYLAGVLGDTGLGSADATRAVYALAGYKFKVEPEVGKAFVRAYIVPQLEGFVRDKVISSYGLYLNLNNISDWSYLIVFEYPDTAAYGRHSNSKPASRTPLTDNSAWVALHGVKAHIRTQLGEFLAQRIIPR